MKILGWRFSNYWLLLLVPVLIVPIPILLIGLFAANDLAGAILGPPAVWNRPVRAPRYSEIAGSYHESKRDWERGESTSKATLHLNVDETMSLANIPGPVGETDCVFSGSGRWKLSEDDSSVIDLIIEKSDRASTCKLDGYPYGIYNNLSVAGRFQPHTLYWTIGDPDSGNGIWFQRD